MRDTRYHDEQSTPWRIAIVEDHLLQRKRVEQIVGAQPGLRIVHSCETFPDLLRWLATADARSRPELVVLDLVVDRGPSVDPERVRRLVDGGVRVLVLSALTVPGLVREVIEAGVGGVVGKRDSEEDLVAAIWAVLGDEHWVTPELAGIIAAQRDRPRLSDQEERALILYASGLTLDGVASELGVRPDTAKKYLSRVKAKYAAVGRPVHTKVDLGREATRDGLLDLAREH